MSETTDKIQDVMSEPRFQSVLAELQSAFPVLLPMGTEKAKMILEGLVGKDTYDGIMELRKNATDEQWAAINKDIVKKGLSEVVKAMDDLKYLRNIFWTLVLKAATGGTGLIP